MSCGLGLPLYVTKNAGKNAETGPQAEVWDWRSILRDIARSSRLPELPDSDCQDRLRGVGWTCVLDLNVRGAYSRVEPPGGRPCDEGVILDRDGVCGRLEKNSLCARQEGVRFGREPKCDII